MNKLFGDADELMVTAAQEYCLHRRSYIVAACCDWLRRIWPDLTEQTQNIILRNTIEALSDGRAPLAYDWFKIGRWMAENVTANQIAEVNKLVAWKGITDALSFLENGYKEATKP